MVKRGYVSGSESTEKRKRETWSSLSLPCEDTARRQSPAGQGVPHENLSLLEPDPRLSASRKGRNTFLWFKPSGLWYLVM